MNQNDNSFRQIQIPVETCVRIKIGTSESEKKDFEVGKISYKTQMRFHRKNLNTIQAMYKVMIHRLNLLQLFWMAKQLIFYIIYMIKIFVFF